MKKFVVYFIIAVFTSFALAETTSVKVKIDHARIETKANAVSIQLDDYGYLTAPGSYRLPQKRVNVILPANAEQITWQASFSREMIPIANAPEKNMPFSDGERFITSDYKSVKSEHVRYAGIGHWGTVTFARFEVLPYTYDESTTSVEKISDLAIEVSYTRNGKSLNNKLPTSIRGNESQFLNPEALDEYYTAGRTRDFDYLIITKPVLYNSLLPLQSLHQQQGMIVRFASVDSILANQAGNDGADKVRNYLISQYQASPFSYLLLVGDINTVPIKVLSAEPNVPAYVPSDFYYTDLSSNFDTDNDGIPGEYSMAEGIDDDGIDFTPELYVGRIPFNDAASVSQICSRIIAYENSNADWKNHVLIPGAILNYAQEDGNPWLMTNSDTWGEFVKQHIFASENVTTMYEQTGLVTSVASTYPLTQENFFNELNNNSYGIINWSAHGSSTSAARKIWTSDENLDTIPQGNECNWEGLVDTWTFDGLANQNGSVFFCASCNNGMLDIEGLCLAEKVLLTKAVADISATRTGWYKIGWENPGWGGLSSYNYHVLENYVNFHQTIGQAQGNANFLHSNYYLFGDPVDSNGIIWPEQQNVYTYLLFGDPAVGYRPTPVSGNGEILVWEPAANPHNADLVQKIRDVTGANVIYTDKLIPDYAYLDHFKAILVLSGFGLDTYQFSLHNTESQMLSDYLTNGGSVYLEGDQFSGEPVNPFIDKFAALAPYSHLANIQTIYGFDHAADSTWGYSGYNAMNKPFQPNTTTTSVFKTGLENNSDVIGIFHQAEQYRTFASAFELNGVTDGTASVNDMLHTILYDYLAIDAPTSNEDNTIVPTAFFLKSYPNPFSNILRIETNMPKTGKLLVEVYNIRGQKIRTLHTGAAIKGTMNLTWNGLDDSGTHAASGVYLIRAKTSDSSRVSKTLLLK